MVSRRLFLAAALLALPTLLSAAAPKTLYALCAAYPPEIAALHREFGVDEGTRVLAGRKSRPDLAPDPDLPDDTRLWAALQSIGGGAWGGCVYDVDRILEVIEAGKRHLSSRP